jgi:hypothetical protein
MVAIDKKKRRTIDIILTFIGAVLCGTGCGFMNYAALGMDAIGSFYDGIRTALNLSIDTIGTVSIGISIVLIIFLLIVKRKYVNIGTIIYLIVYGIFANISTLCLEKLITSDAVYVKAVISILGILILTYGLGIYIAVDIGVDPFTGLTLYLSDITHKEMQYIKIAIDIIFMVIGILLGARIGAISVISVLAEGPLIAFFTKRVQLWYFKLFFSRKRSAKK